MTDALIGVDLGGTSIKLAVGTAQGELLKTHSLPTEAHLGPDSVIDRMVKSIAAMTAEVDRPISAIGVGAPGLIDVSTGATQFLPNLHTQWKGVPLGVTLADHFQCPVMVANDARTATLGELRFGYGKQQENLTLAFFTLGTGVGGGVAIEGQLRLGAFGAAGELGHQTIDPHGPRCGCGNHGCLETYASGPAITAAAIRLMRSGQAPELHRLCEGDAQRVTIEAMAQVYSAEESIREAIHDAARAIGIASANVTTAIHPDLIVLGGGVAELGDKLIAVVKEEIDRRVKMFPTKEIQVVKSKLGVHAGVLGAIALGLLAIEKKLPIRA